MESGHAIRRHSRFAASSSERIMNCPGSVKLSEGMPDKTSPAALEGTKCHEVVERIVTGRPYRDLNPSFEMVPHARQAATYVLAAHARAAKGSDLLVESKVSLAFIHPEAFGTLDYAIIEHFGVLNIMDFKYGTHLVSAIKNLQLIFYALGVAHANHWAFSHVRLTIIQPRASGYDGPSFWELTIEQLKSFIPRFKAAYERAEKFPNQYKEGYHCFFCKGRVKCPLKTEGRMGSLIKNFEMASTIQKGNLKWLNSKQAKSKE